MIKILIENLKLAHETKIISEQAYMSNILTLTLCGFCMKDQAKKMLF